MKPADLKESEVIKIWEEITKEIREAISPEGKIISKNGQIPGRVVDFILDKRYSRIIDNYLAKKEK